MDNKVVQTLARAFVGCGWTRGALQLPRRRRQRRRARRRPRRVRGHARRGRQLAPEGPLAIAGFSFGAFVASCAIERLWASRDIRAGGAGRHGCVALFRRDAAGRVARARAGRAWRAGRHGAARRRDGLGAAAVTSCHSRSRRRSFLSRTIAAAQESRRPPSARGLVFLRLRIPMNRLLKTLRAFAVAAAASVVLSPWPRCRRRPRSRRAASCCSTSRPTRSWRKRTSTPPSSRPR